MAFFNLTQLGGQDPIKDAVQPIQSDSQQNEKTQTEQSHKGSHEKYTTQLQKHQRNEKGPNELYKSPVATSMNYGWWMKDEEERNKSWTHVPRKAHVNSEMTKFVDEMALTNRDFSLF
ncbi:sperm microtubule inner protein 11-like [Oscarella lobularis]|uniref:sperm microtubule inner protein 11-like n=1 Tax=Oscarella lobularis TaxID=121494 RepID=UPI003313184D